MSELAHRAEGGRHARRASLDAGDVIHYLAAGDLNNALLTLHSARAALQRAEESIQLARQATTEETAA